MTLIFAKNFIVFYILLCINKLYIIQTKTAALIHINPMNGYRPMLAKISITNVAFFLIHSPLRNNFIMLSLLIIKTEKIRTKGKIKIFKYGEKLISLKL